MPEIMAKPGDPVVGRDHALGMEEFVAVLRASGLAERRPVDDAERIAGMVSGANLIVTARVDGLLVGIARSVTDFAYCCYLSDLAVDQTWQGKGVGRRLIAETRRLIDPRARLLLLSAPGAITFYEQAGLPRLDNAFDVPVAFGQ